MKSFIITSDDYGISDEINQAIINLIESKKINKISIMQGEFVIANEITNSTNIKSGLHIDFIYRSLLSENNKIVSITPFKLFKNCYFSRNFCKSKYLQHISYQAEYIKSKGFNINYLDTHLHVHILPKILDILVEFAINNNIRSIRCITMDFKYFPQYIYMLFKNGYASQAHKIIFIYFMGIFMRKKLIKNKIQFSRNLVLMPLAKNKNYDKLLTCLVNLFKNDNVEIVVHPGMIQKAPFDGYNIGRLIEYNSLKNLNIHEK